MQLLAGFVRKSMLVVCMPALLSNAAIAADVASGSAQLADAAAKLERDGNKAAAIVVYEQLAEQDPLSKRVVAHRLVRLHADAGNVAAALAWAKEVTRNHPDPEAYMAGIHFRCGNHSEAEAILTKALKAKNIPRLREITLRWQLADVYQAGKQPGKAEGQLRKALARGAGHPEEAAAQKRLSAFVEKQKKR